MNSWLGALALLLCLSVSAVATPLEEISDKTYPLSPTGSLSVRNSDGVIYIYSWLENSVRVMARKRAYSAERLQRISADVSLDGDSITISTKVPPKPQGLSLADRSGTMDYVIFLPQKASVSAELTTGELIIDGIYGSKIDARLTSGRMMLQNCFADIHAKVGQGGLDVIYAWWEAKHFSFNAKIAHGHLNASVPSFASLQVDAQSGDGNVSNQFAADPGAKEQMGKIRVTIGDGSGADFKLQAAHGNIEIRKNE